MESKKSRWWLSRLCTVNIWFGVTVLWVEEKKEQKSNPGLIDFVFLMSLCGLLFTNGAHVCSMSISSSHRHGVWSTQDKASGVHVERNVLVQLQTWQSRFFSCDNLTNNLQTSELKKLGLIWQDKNTKTQHLPARRRTSSHLRKHSQLNPNPSNPEV